MKRAAVVMILFSLLAVGCAAQVKRSGTRTTPEAPTVTGLEPTTRPTPSSVHSTAELGPSPSFLSRITPIDEATRSRLSYSWHAGCPVGLDDLRLLTLSYWGFDDHEHTGELVVHRDVAHDVVQVFGKLFEAAFPIERMRLVDAYRADDDRSMAADNTSAFNCRYATGHPGVWSEHAYGRAIDINPLLNPYVGSDGSVLPPGGSTYAHRSRTDAGMIHDGDVVVRAFAEIGWGWGGGWTSFQDYQHFSQSGR
jgi:hypothetical protein